jgi:chemosensory pili system protein ChpC
LSLPLEGCELLVPGSLVAEVVPYLSHTPAQHDSPWMLGRIPWRGVALPLVSFELAAGLCDAPPAGRRVAVFNTIGGNPALPFYALFIRAVPHLLPLDRNALTEKDEATTSPLIRSQVDYAGTTLSIPDIDKFEAVILDSWSSIHEQ